MARDRQGLELTGSARSAAAFDSAVADYFGLTGDPVGTLERALAEDKSFLRGEVGGRRRDRPRTIAPRRGYGLGRGPLGRGPARLGAHSSPMAARRAGAALRAGWLLFPGRSERAARFGRARPPLMGARQSFAQLHPRRLRLWA